MVDDPRFTMPLYTLPLAASHLAMPASTLGSWARKSNLLTMVPGEGREPRLPFIGLVEAQLYRELRKAKLSMQAITAGMAVVRRELGDRMLERGVLATDGREILMNLGGQERAEWERARDRQGGLPEVIEIGLKPIIYMGDDLPGRLRLTAYGDTPVIADPLYSFGQPIVETSGARVEDVLSLFKAGEKLSIVADEMGLGEDDVESIVRTHLTLAA
ncbi:MAG: hypothetical protein LBV30_04955 [Propionibacteriaceae bacterium]|jgi:uncharacterized protein (DUF433 family)|nr:hypothetical protein [Propionibacteriaceae bacterium]